MVVVGQYDNIPDAWIAKGRLEAEGIPCRLADQHLVQADWLYSIAVGGIKLQVAPAHAARAREILAADFSGDLE